MMNKLDKKWQLKIICLLMAIVLWFFIINEQNPMSEGSYTVPIVVENLDSQYITSNVPKTVYVRLSGPRNTIINVGPSDIKAYIDLSDAQEGEMSAPVRIEIPAGTELKKQSMTSADIMVDVYTVRELALTPHLVGQTKNDIFVSSLKVVPEKVVISGARRLVKQVEQAVVEIPIEDRIDDFSIMAPIRLVAADGSRIEGLEMTPWQSNIRISIGHNAVTKDIPVYVTTEGDGGLYLTVTTADGVNTCFVDLGERSVKMTDADCSVSKDCTYMPALDGGDGAIVCVPNRIRIVPVGGISAPVTG